MLCNCYTLLVNARFQALMPTKNQAMKSEKQINSIYDLAKEAGVSYATVSRVLNGRGRTSAEARNKVLAAAEKHDFRPRMQARRTTIAMVFNTGLFALDQEYFITLIASLVKQLSYHDLCLEFYSHHNISKLRGAMIDGIIGLPWDLPSTSMLQGLPRNIPKVIPNAFGPDCCSMVMSDHYQSGRMAAEYLLANGHHSAGAIISNTKDKANAERARGFFETYANAGHEQPSRMLCDLRAIHLMDALDRIRSSSASALFLGTEGRTQAFASMMRRMRISIPDDLSVVAMESWGLSCYMDPPYTAIQQPIELVAAKTVDLLLGQIASGDGTPQQVMLDNQFFERDSVRNLKAVPMLEASGPSANRRLVVDGADRGISPQDADDMNSPSDS